MANLKLFHINKIYDGGVHAVKDFCLDVEDREFVVFVGPSGCGKSTVLRMIAGLEKITSGDLYIGNRVVNALPPKDRNIAMVFQNYALFPNMSVYDNISYGLRMNGTDKEIIKEKVEEAAEILNLKDHLHKKPSQLSGGQRQRVALGRAMVRNPDVFLLDEPLSNLDAKLRNRMRKELMALHHRLNATFIYVTHDQVEAMTMGDKIVAMRDGTIMQIGSPTTLYNHPANMFVAGFIGSPQMNFWNGTVVTGGYGKISISTPIGEFPLNTEQRMRFCNDAKTDGKRVVVGMRPEDITVTRKNPDDVEIFANISVIENFCSHSVFHGDMNGCEIVGQDKLTENIQGKLVRLYANVENIHIFDAETEDSLLPIYPEATTLNGVKEGNTLKILGTSLTLPQRQSSEISDGPLTVRIALNAITDGTIPATCCDVIRSDNSCVSVLDFGSETVWALGDYSNKKYVGIDLSRIEIIGREHIKAIPDRFILPFTYERVRERDGGENEQKHYCVFGSERVEAFYEFNKKMYRLGRSIFKNEYKLHLGIDNLRPAREDECYPVLRATVEEVLDYGDRQYSKVCFNGSTLYVPGRLTVGSEALIAVDLDNAHVSTSNSDTILF